MSKAGCDGSTEASDERITRELIFLKVYDAFKRQLPKVVVREKKETYERLLAGFDRIARANGGKICGKVDFKDWFATINLTLPFLEFFTGDQMALLRDVAQNADAMLIQPSKENQTVTVIIDVKYFRDLPLDIDDREALLAVLKKAAQQVEAELRPEDAENYLDRILELL